MAKRKKNKKDSEGGRMAVLLAAKNAHKRDVGVGGKACDPTMSHVRGIRLPGLGMMNMLGFSALRDSCTVLIDGQPGSSKSSLAIDMFNWGAPYAAGGAICDCENKAAFDIAEGLMNQTTLWLPGNLRLSSCQTVEAAQEELLEAVKRCKTMNEELPRDDHIPAIMVLDPLTGSPSEETKKAIIKNTHADRGHAGRQEALLWSVFIKDLNSTLVDLPIIAVFVNHTKEKQKQVGARSITVDYNPGGLAQNYATTIQLRCQVGKRQITQAVDGMSYEVIYISCKKNSRGPTGLKTSVRKYSQRMEDGTTRFWFDWERNTAEFLADVSGKHPTKDVVVVTKTSDTKFSCSKLGLKDEDPAVIGHAIMSDHQMMDELISACRIRKIKEFNRLTDEELQQLSDNAQEYKQELMDKADADE
jgi:hypothetical protein